MKRIIYAACIMVCTAALIWSCSGGGGGSSSTPGTTGTLVITGATSTTTAFAKPLTLNQTLMAPTLYSMVTVTSVQLKPYRFYLAKNADCSNPILVQNNDATAVYEDFMLNPTVYSGSVEAGTYNCLIVESSDLIKFTTVTGATTATGGVCNDGATYTFDTYKTENPIENQYDIVTNTTTTGSGTYYVPVEQKVTFFMSTGVTPKGLKSDGSVIRTAYPSVLDTQAIQLLSPIVITAGGSTKAAFVVDPTGRVDTVNDGSGGGDVCWLEGATINFITQ